MFSHTFVCSVRWLPLVIEIEVYNGQCDIGVVQWLPLRDIDIGLLIYLLGLACVIPFICCLFSNHTHLNYVNGWGI